MIAIIVVISVLIIFLSIRWPLYKPTGKINGTLRLTNGIFKVLFPSLIIALIFGLRDNVGVDYPAYKTIYLEDFSADIKTTLERTPVEWLFTYICWFLKVLNLPYYWMFIIMAFIPLLFYMMFIKNYPKQALLSTYFLFATGVIFWYFNIMRQGVAFFILLYSIKYIAERKFWSYLFWIFIAAGFHASSYLFVIFYFLFKSPKSYPTYLILSVYLSSWCLSSFVLNSLFSKVGGLILVGTPYAKYANNIATWEMGGGMGLGVLSLHIVDICIIALTRVIYNKFRTIRLDIFYNIFLIGTVIANLAGNNMILSRIPFCMVSLRFFLAGCTVWYIQRYWKSLSFAHRLQGLGILIFSSLYLLGNFLYTDYKFII